MTDLISWVAAGAGLFFCWLLWELIATFIGEAAWEAAGPLRRPIWRMFVSASWPWPLLALLGCGAAVVAVGLWLLNDLSREGFEGVGLLLSGVAVVLISPLLWRDARRDREKAG